MLSLSLFLLALAAPADGPAASGTSDGAPVVVIAPANAQEARVVTLFEAIESTRRSNLTWQTLGEYLRQAAAGKRVGWAMLLPKVQAQGQWVHMGERHEPDMSALTSFMDAMLGQSSSSGSNPFGAFVPPVDSLAATFSLIVPVINAPGIAYLRGANRQEDAALQRIGYGREQLLFGVAKAYYGLLTMQSMISVNDQSISSAREHFRTNQVKASLQAVTQLQVKRAELEVNRAESQKAELLAGLEKTKAAFRYLTTIDGPFSVADPELPALEQEYDLDHWLKVADESRKDLAAVRIETAVADIEVDKVWSKYLPTVNLIGQAKIDNQKEQRFDTDEFSWNVIGTLTWDLWDGGFREAELSLVKSKYRQARYAQEDLERKIKSDVSSAYQALQDAVTARKLAERQLDVARDTQHLAKVSEEAGVATNLEVIDANTMVFGSEAQLLTAQLKEAMAVLDLLAATGKPLPFPVRSSRARRPPRAEP